MTSRRGAESQRKAWGLIWEPRTPMREMIDGNE